MDSTYHRDISLELKGKKLYIPNLDDTLSSLAADSSPQFQTLSKMINSRLDMLIKDPLVRQKVDRVNLPVFAARWWPYATLECQEAMTLFNLWLFVWDDVFDGEDEVEGRPTNMDEIYERTIEYVAYHLGLTEPWVREPVAPSPATSLFRHAGEIFQRQVDLAQRWRFFAELKYYIENCAVEQKYLDKGVLPTVREYWSHRWGTSSVFAGCALAEYTAGVKLPEELFQTPELWTLWTETNRNVVIINDLLSLKKEMHGSLHSLVPITMQDTGRSLDSVVSDLMNELRWSVRQFNKAARSLLDMVDGNRELRADVARYIQLLEHNQTGNLSWTLECGRYNVGQYVQADGSMVIPL